MFTSLRRGILVGVFGLAALAALVVRQPQTVRANSGPGVEPGDPPLIDLAGYNDLVARYRGKAVMVNFWATWCGPCRTEYPEVVDLGKEYGPQGLIVLGVTLDEDSDIGLVRKFLATYHPDFPNFRQRPGIDPDAFYQGVNPQWRGTMPQTDFYARDGHMARFFIGDKPRDAFVQAIRLILAVPVGQEGASRSTAGN